jgi:hypothetical protein
LQCVIPATKHRDGKRIRGGTQEEWNRLHELKKVRILHLTAAKVKGKHQKPKKAFLYLSSWAHLSERSGQ